MTLGAKQEEIIFKTNERFFNDLSKFDKELLRRVLLYLAQHTSDGRISIPIDELAQLEQILYDEIKNRTSYEQIITGYLAKLSDIDKLNIEEQIKSNKLKREAVTSLWNNSEKRQLIQSQLIRDLGQQGISTKFIEPLVDIIREQSVLNRTFKEAEVVLRELSDGYSERYVKQVATDAIRQYNGAFEDEVRIAFNFKTLRYIGNEIGSTRPLCSHILDKYNGRLTAKQLKDVLDEYCPLGIPSSVKETYETINGIKRTLKKGSGMYDNTFVENFSQKRGGYECRHRAKWSR